MVTNVSEKDKTLQQVIDYCKSKRKDCRIMYTRTTNHNHDDRMILCAGMRAYGHIIDYCTHMLGYRGHMPSYLNYEDIDDSSPDMQPQVGDYGVAIRENSHGQQEIPFHIEREEHTGLPVALLNMQLYAKPEDDIDHGQYVSLFQLYLDGFALSRTGRNAAQNQNEDAK